MRKSYARARQVVKAGDILFSTVRTYLKNIASVPSIYDGQIASTGFCVIRPADGINPTFIFLLTQKDDFLNPLNELQRGTSYPAVRDSDVFAQFVPLAPLAEQRRMVAKIEELFSDLDAGIAALQKTTAQLKRYRQAVLKAAVEGRLTARWREANKGKLESTVQRLEREKKERFEKQIESAKALLRTNVINRVESPNPEPFPYDVFRDFLFEQVIKDADLTHGFLFSPIIQSFFDSVADKSDPMELLLNLAVWVERTRSTLSEHGLSSEVLNAQQRAWREEAERLKKGLPRRILFELPDTSPTAVMGEWMFLKHLKEDGIAHLRKMVEDTARDYFDHDERLREARQVNETNLPDLPEGWQWVSLQQLLAEPLNNGKSVSTAASGFPVLRLTAIRSGRIDLSETKKGAWTEEQARPYLVREGDFFVSRGSGSIKFVGRGGLVQSEPYPVAYPDTFIRVRVDSAVYSAKFLQTVWESPFIRLQIETTARTTAGIYKINQRDLEKCLLVLPPLAEQQQIVAGVERRLSVADEIEKVVEQSLKQAERLRQSILKRAFAGRLVPQDLNDGPAEKLLERIKQERAKREGEGNRQKKNRKQSKPKQLDLI